MYFSKVSAVLVALAVSIPDVVAAPSSLELVSDDPSTTSINLGVRGVPKVRPIIKPMPKGPDPKYVIQEPDKSNSDKQDISTTAKPPQTTQKPGANPPVTQQPQGFKGSASYYYQGGYTGKCGKVYQDGDFVAVLDQRRFDMSLCDKKIRIVTPQQRWVGVTVVDPTEGGVDENHLDLSLGSFQTISRVEDGMVLVTWNYI
jgi:hypothetical protein